MNVPAEEYYLKSLTLNQKIEDYSFLLKLGYIYVSKGNNAEAYKKLPWQQLELSSEEIQCLDKEDLETTIDFILTNLQEMNRLWIRVQLYH